MNALAAAAAAAAVAAAPSAALTGCCLRISVGFYSAYPRLRPEVGWGLPVRSELRQQLQHAPRLLLLLLLHLELPLLWPLLLLLLPLLPLLLLLLLLFVWHLQQ
jgi:hypothetical protein